jgi:hypothetical protein
LKVIFGVGMGNTEFKDMTVSSSRIFPRQRTAIFGSWDSSPSPTCGLEVLILLLPNKFLCQGVVAEPRGASREPGIWEQRTLPMSIIISNTYTIKQIQTVGPKYLSMGLLPLPPAKKKENKHFTKVDGLICLLKPNHF